jgi:hypothetical protein
MVLERIKGKVDLQQQETQRIREQQEAQQEAAAISEQIRLQLEQALRDNGQTIARPRGFGRDPKTRTQVVLEDTIPYKNISSINVEVRGFLQENVESIEEAEFEYVFMFFPEYPEEIFSFKQGEYRNLGDFSMNIPFIRQGDLPWRSRLGHGEENISLNEARHLRDNVVLPLFDTTTPRSLPQETSLPPGF